MPVLGSVDPVNEPESEPEPDSGLPWEPTEGSSQPITAMRPGLPDDPRRPLVLDVRRGSLDDGPGLRSVVFFKGCPLRCVFCHNPEAQDARGEIAFAEERCLRCARCAGACAARAIDLDSPSRIDRGACDRCGRCAEACPTGALRRLGKHWPVEALAELLLRDLPFYRHSGGGVTVSGGECTMFPDYLESLLRTLRAAHVHLALETSGFFDHGTFARRILPHLDLVLFDVKLVDRDASLRHLGASSERMVENLRALVADGRVEVRARIPIVPGITDTPENLRAVVDLLRAAGVTSLTPLPYNPLGLAKYAQLGRSAPELPPRFTPPGREKQVLDLLRDITSRRGNWSEMPWPSTW